jgi:hypothetical protein
MRSSQRKPLVGRLAQRRRERSYDVAFVADNPGIWMDHCHNLNTLLTAWSRTSYTRVSTPHTGSQDQLRTGQNEAKPISGPG